MKIKILWSVYENRRLTGAMAWGTVRAIYGGVLDGSVIAVRRDSNGRLIAKDPHVGEPFTVAGMERCHVWSLPHLPSYLESD